MAIKTIKKFMGFEYITAIVPIRPSKFGDVINVKPQILEQKVAQLIICKGVPIRGRELKFLRKHLGLSLEKFARKLDLSSTSIFKWEADPKQRLAPINEVAVRSLFAEIMDIDLPGKYSKLLGKNDDASEELVFKAS